MASRKRAAKHADGSSSESAPQHSGGTEQKPLATGDVDQFPAHSFRADLGQGLPDVRPPLNPDRAK